MTRPSSAALHGNNIIDLRKEVEDRLSRLELEVIDDRVYPIFIPALAVGTLTASNNLIFASRDRRYTQLQVSGFGTAAGSALTVTLYTGAATPFAAGDRALQIVLNAGAGWRSSSTSAIVNVGKDYIDDTIAWGLDITAAGAAWTNVLVELVYQDFVRYLRSS